MNDDFYNSAEARLDTVAGKQSYWLRLKSANKEYSKNIKRQLLSEYTSGFKDYMRDTYGVDIHSDSDGNILPTHTIVDEQKHLIFLLKHSKHEN